MATHLRIHHDDSGGTRTDEHAPEVLPFPMKAVRERLVAGTVHKDPRLEAPPHPPASEPGRSGSAWGERATVVIKFPGVPGVGRRDDVTGTSELVSRIEETLERMQERLNSFREQLDDTFKFPAGHGMGRDEPPYPPAA